LTNLCYFRLLRVLKAGVPNYFESSGVYTYKRIPVLDASTSSSDLLDKADEIVDFIASGLCHGSVLVHCQRGVSRSTTAVVMYLMRYVNLMLCYLHQYAFLILYSR
jgi:protein-tyrosine phosphatase